MGAFPYDFLHETPGQPRWNRSYCGPGEAAVEIAAVDDVPGVVDEAIGVDHRNGDDGSVQAGERGQLQESSDDLDPVHLVSVDGPADKEVWAVDFSSNDVHRHVDRHVRVERRQRQVQGGARSRNDLPVMYDQFRLHGAVS